MAETKSFRELNVYKKSREQAKVISHLTKSFPREERFALIDQIRRSSRAVGAMPAEAWARRRYEAAFVNKVDEALGEAMKTQAWLDSALDCEYLDPKRFAELDTAWQHIGAMLNRMMEESEAFCRSAAK